MVHSLDKLLENYIPFDSWEQECKERMLAFIARYDNCFERSLEIGHFTGSAWLLNHDKTKALLTHHTKLDKWLQLGGHCDGDSDVLSVATKEAQEESGIQNIIPISTTIFDIDIHLFPTRGQQKEHYHYDVRFLLQVVGSESVTQNHESKELRWISKNLNDLPTSSRSVVRMFEKWLAL
ncbi:TPA: NUDIX hydrolase [Candidatus Dependentiae bacterium]|nr:MAG: (Di)nucleoside polyphosphate hydrolase [candidate division TM6 bacterium GW2011_GWF2_36_131]KKQ03128.1 MAG: (Di)nucleoside polyphosphate hydrolase [candidate division TM6 bacterium GW2011_GWE2_36_25]KKQ19384.1 MAG: (Di)nucleoside polyphosphate hydrolase [candidate division TM6 bacterium GW2011_GWA2_36_9]HBR71029.1 NUDIX hydrolase [Candidatus Dependentiae bacterium]HCU01103.1 NUDIX hydrolase [Candidatus Dependentiae bacterium]